VGLIDCPVSLAAMTLDYRSLGFRQCRCSVQASRASTAARSVETLAARIGSETIGQLAREALTAAEGARAAAGILDHSTAIDCAQHAMALEAQALALERAN
jgi:hypothetical protein